MDRIFLLSVVLGAGYGCQSGEPSPGLQGVDASRFPPDAASLVDATRPEPPPSKDAGGDTAFVSDGAVVKEPGLIVHEWGTFTSMVGSDGMQLEGLHHEDEPLPDFVYRRSREYTRKWKGMEAPPREVTQKLETPVVYFYGDREQPVSLRVDFPLGVVSEWYPASASFAPDLDPAAASTKPSAGSMTWDFRLDPGIAPAAFPEVAADDIWAPSRNVRATPLAVGSEKERFIFYRGIGAFSLPIVIREAADSTLDIRNDSDDRAPEAFLLRVHEFGGAIVPLGELPARSVKTQVAVPVLGKERNLDVYVDDARAKISAALVRSGLYEDEATAMVDTWTRSYFKTPGLRVLYVVPRGFTDALLPLSVTPAPREVVRTLVGRVEVLRRADETSLVAMARQAKDTGTNPRAYAASLGRFAEPKLRRTIGLTTDGSLVSFLESAVAATNELSIE